MSGSGPGASPLFPSTFHKNAHLNGQDFAVLIAGGNSGGSGDDGEDGDGADSDEETVVRRLNDPRSMRGATEEDVAALAQEAGLQSAPLPPTAATGGRGCATLIRRTRRCRSWWRPGDPKVADAVHQGPYMKWQIKGGGRGSALRVPLDGNPNPASGFDGDAPEVIAKWGPPSAASLVRSGPEGG